MDINKKIILYLDFKGISQRQFTATCKLSEGVLRRGKNIGSGYLNSIKTNYPDLNMNWLLFNEGNMIVEANNMVNDKHVEYHIGTNSNGMSNTFETLKELLKAKDETIKILKHQLGIDNEGNGNSKAG